MTKTPAKRMQKDERMEGVERKKKRGVYICSREGSKCLKREGDKIKPNLPAYQI